MSKPRGTAALTPEQIRRIASMGGKKAHANGSAYTFTSEEARRAGRKGGLKSSRDRQHMAEIGRKGGLSRNASPRKKPPKVKPTPKEGLLPSERVLQLVGSQTIAIRELEAKLRRPLATLVCYMVQRGQLVRAGRGLIRRPT